MEKNKNRFNLVEVDWIPVVNVGLVSLRRIFSDSKLRALGGNPVQKIALTKLLLAICQAAYTPEDDEAWAKLGPGGMAKKSLQYLEDKKDLFWLYGDKPFLQMPKIENAKKQPFGAVLPDVATGNTTVLVQSQIEKTLNDAEIALLVIQLMGFALGGKKTDNSVVLSTNFHGKSNEKGKPSTGRPGASVGFMGYLHNLLLGDNLQTSLWLNIITLDTIKSSAVYTKGIGIAPWEKMPKGENCNTAQNLKNSLMGRLIPLSRFILITADSLHYSEGILHPTYKDGVVDPSVAVNFSEKKTKVLWVNTEKRPWRMITSLLSFLETDKTNGFNCLLIESGIKRSRIKISKIGIWSGGLQVSSNAGEQYVSGSDDFVESEIFLESSIIGKDWFALLKQEMSELDILSKRVYVTVNGFYRDQKVNGEKLAGQASNLFWQLCERKFQTLVDACIDQSQVKALRPVFAQFVNKSYDDYCPHETARQLDAWAKNRPNLGKYLKKEEKISV